MERRRVLWKLVSGLGFARRRAKHCMDAGPRLELVIESLQVALELVIEAAEKQGADQPEFFRGGGLALLVGLADGGKQTEPVQGRPSPKAAQEAPPMASTPTPAATMQIAQLPMPSPSVPPPSFEKPMSDVPKECVEATAGTSRATLASSSSAWMGNGLGQTMSPAEAAQSSSSAPASDDHPPVRPPPGPGKACRSRRQRDQAWREAMRSDGAVQVQREGNHAGVPPISPRSVRRGEDLPVSSWQEQWLALMSMQGEGGESQ